MISGYVGVHSKPKYSSILLLWIQVVFYSTILSLAAHFIWPEMVSGSEWIKGFLPVNFKYYWYYSAYFFLSLLIPMINKALKQANIRELAAGLTAIVLLSLNGTLFQKDAFLAGQGYSPLWLLALYMMGGYIKLHGEHLRVYRWIQKRPLLWYALGTTAAWGVKIAAGNRSLPIVFDQRLHSDMLLSYISPAIILSSVALFALFAGWKPKEQLCKWLTVIAPATFGVYLIHVHPQIWRYCIADAFISFTHIKAYVLPFAILGAAVGILAVCIVIDLIRGKLFRLLKVKEGCQYLMERIGMS